MPKRTKELHIMPPPALTKVLKRAYSPRQRVMGNLSIERPNGERDTVIGISIGFANKYVKSRSVSIRMALFVPYTISLKVPTKD